MSEEQKDSIGVKEAVRIAGEVIRDLYEDENISDLLLEEVRRGGDDVWLITMSFTRPARRSGPGIGGLAGLMAPPKSFKQVRIDAKTGEFQGMEIRVIPKPPEQENAPGYNP